MLGSALETALSTHSLLCSTKLICELTELAGWLLSLKTLRAVASSQAFALTTIAPAASILQHHTSIKCTIVLYR